MQYNIYNITTYHHDVWWVKNIDNAELMTEKLLCKRNLSIENNDPTLCSTKTDKNFYFWQHLTLEDEIERLMVSKILL